MSAAFDTRTMFYGQRCAPCNLAWKDDVPDERWDDPKAYACPRCGDWESPDSEPMMCSAERVLELRDHPDTHASLVAEAERVMANLGR
jgi:hypothetical protein